MIEHQVSVRKFKDLIVQALDRIDADLKAGFVRRPVTHDKQYALLELGPGKYLVGGFSIEGYCCPIECVLRGGRETVDDGVFGGTFDYIVTQHLKTDNSALPLVLDVRRTLVDRFLGY